MKKRKNAFSLRFITGKRANIGFRCFGGENYMHLALWVCGGVKQKSSPDRNRPDNYRGCIKSLEYKKVAPTGNRPDNYRGCIKSLEKQKSSPDRNRTCIKSLGNFYSIH